MKSWTDKKKQKTKTFTVVKHLICFERHPMGLFNCFCGRKNKINYISYYSHKKNEKIYEIILNSLCDDKNIILQFI